MPRGGSNARFIRSPAPARGSCSPRPIGARTIVTLVAASVGAGATTTQGKHMARRALLAGGAAIAPALLVTEAAFAKKPARPPPGRDGGSSSRAAVQPPHPVTKVDLDGRRLVAIGDVPATSSRQCVRLSYPSAWMLLGTGSAAPRFWFKWGTFSTVAITSSPSS